MRSAASGLIFLVITCLYPGCKKDETADESDLYGTWVKGSHNGDTLWFMKKNGKNIMRKPESFNALMPSYSEKEYRLENGNLSVKTFAPASQDYHPITTFGWTDRGKEFTIQSTELFLILSSITTFKYKKI